MDEYNKFCNSLAETLEEEGFVWTPVVIEQAKVISTSA